jgi:hypothetical protein
MVQEILAVLVWSFSRPNTIRATSITAPPRRTSSSRVHAWRAWRGLGLRPDRLGSVSFG